MSSKQKTKSTPDAVDKYVGAQVKKARTMSGMSQERLAKLLGVTFQQVQKYERGINRVAAGRLAHIAHTLEKPVAWFFPALYSPDVSDYDAEIDRLRLQLFSTIEKLRLMANEIGLTINLGQSILTMDDKYHRRFYGGKNES